MNRVNLNDFFREWKSQIFGIERNSESRVHNWEQNERGRKRVVPFILMIFQTSRWMTCTDINKKSINISDDIDIAIVIIWNGIIQHMDRMSLSIFLCTCVFHIHTSPKYLTSGICGPVVGTLQEKYMCHQSCLWVFKAVYVCHWISPKNMKL